MTYQVDMSKQQKKYIDKLDNKEREGVEGTIADLSSNPRPHNSTEMVSGEWSGCLRVKAGSRHRIIYSVDDDVRVVAIERIGHRDKVY